MSKTSFEKQKRNSLLKDFLVLQVGCSTKNTFLIDVQNIIWNTDKKTAKIQCRFNT